MLQPLGIPAHIELLGVAADDAKSEPAVERQGAVAAYYIESDRPPYAARTIDKPSDQTGPDPTIAELGEDVELMQMEPVDGLRNLHPANVGAAHANHLGLLRFEPPPKPRDGSALIPPAERSEQPFRAVEVEVDGKLVIIRPRRAKRDLGRPVRLFLITRPGHNVL